MNTANQADLPAKCAHCAGHIAFPPEMVGQTVFCPHCGGETPLLIAHGAPSVMSKRVQLGLDTPFHGPNGVPPVMPKRAQPVVQPVARGRGGAKTICPSCYALDSEKEDITREVAAGIAGLLFSLVFQTSGFLFSVFRPSLRDKSCSACGSSGLVSVSTTRGRELLARGGG